MYINNVAYETPTLHPSLGIRIILFEKFYSDMNYINSLMESISKFIDYSTIEFDEYNFQFNIKIKKTIMKSKKIIKKNDSIYYRGILINIFNDFLQKHKNEIIKCLKDKNFYETDEEYQLAYNMSTSLFSLSTIANITCYSDNIIIIKL